MEEIKEIKAILEDIQRKRGDLSQYKELLQEISDKIDRLDSGFPDEQPKEKENRKSNENQDDLTNEIAAFNKYW